MDLKLEYYEKHNYHNEKVVEWIAKHYDATTIQESYGCHDPVCRYCETVEKEDGYHFLLDDKGNETDNLYEAYYEKIDGEELAEEVPGLTEEEK
ncbi:hypothetical protein, partial [Bacillus cereus]|uniref:hypothetical protein n=1 Tax=Bacillus cereus TaxID=1396 RepID=UPI000C001009